MKLTTGPGREGAILETAPWEQVEAALFDGALRQLRRVYQVSPHYRRRLDAAGVNPEKIRTAFDFADVPFFDKHEERESQAAAPPLGGHLCVPRERLARIYASSGTTGTPTSFASLTVDTMFLSSRSGSAERTAASCEGW